MTSVPDELMRILAAQWAERDVASLRDTLYRRAYAREFGASTTVLDAGEVCGASALCARLREANQSRERWESGWRIEHVEPTESITATRGACRRTADPGEYALTFTEELPPRAGMAATLLRQKESLTLQSGVYYAFGESTEEEPDAEIRVYFHAPEDVLPALYLQLTSRLNGLGIPFTLKSLLAPTERDRSDGTVLYVARRDWERAVAAVPEELIARLRPRVPLFALAAHPGIGVAESPVTGESFGMHRCRLLAESILEADGAAARLDALRRRFRGAGVDLVAPHLQQRRTASSNGAGEIVEWLRGRGALRADESCRVKIHSSRNYNFAILREDGSGYFIKRLRVRAAESLRMMEREVAVYGLLANSGLVPAFHEFDRSSRTLVLEWIRAGRSVAEAHLDGFSEPIAREAARTLSALHQRAVGNQPFFDLCFDFRPPGVYTAHRGGPLVQWLGAGQMQLIGLVRGHPVLAAALDQMAAEWRCERLIHGDVKWENCVWTSSSLRWVDWELADLGDPCWDAGCFVHSYLLPGSFDFSRARRLFIEEYTTAMGVPAERILRCAAARLIQAGLEVMHGRPAPTPEALRLLELSARVMARPGDFV